MSCRRSSRMWTPGTQLSIIIKHCCPAIVKQQAWHTLGSVCTHCETDSHPLFLRCSYAIITRTAAKGRLLETLDMLAALSSVRNLPTTVK